jgi:hypothetical protein
MSLFGEFGEPRLLADLGRSRRVKPTEVAVVLNADWGPTCLGCERGGSGVGRADCREGVCGEFVPDRVREGIALTATPADTSSGRRATMRSRVRLGRVLSRRV